MRISFSIQKTFKEAIGQMNDVEALFSKRMLATLGFDHPSGGWSQ